MQYRRLGKTGLSLSVLSLGSGGPNQFGQMRYVSRKNIDALVRRAVDLGINYFDSASSYSDSESILGRALRGIPRDYYHLSSKVSPVRMSRVISPADVKQLVERSLRRLAVDTLDIFFFHGVAPEFYAETLERLLPAVQDLRSEGKIRYIGITESSKRDRRQVMLGRALQDDIFDTVMVAYDIAHSNADQEVLPLALEKDVGVIGMVAARNLVSRSVGERMKLFRRTLLGLITSPPGPSTLNLRLRDVFSPLLPSGSGAELSMARDQLENFPELPAAGYTFAISHPAVTTVLSGTTDVVHLEQNVRAALAPALTPTEIAALRKRLQRQSTAE